MNARTLLELARVSNLPTVWSNVLAGAALAGPEPDLVPVAVAGVAGSLFYSGGMLLNDAFDAEIDARERPDRPIPSGRASRRNVFALGFGLLAVALSILALYFGALAESGGLAPAGVGLGIAAAVVVYDRWHKGVVWAPLVMGLCRAGLYVLGALAVTSVAGSGVVLAAASLLLYVVGLTYVARFESASALGRLWPTAFLLAPALAVIGTARVADLSPESLALLGATFVLHFGWTLRALALALRGGRDHIRRAVVALIAGISLVDAAFIALGRSGELGSVTFAIGAFALTLFLQRWVRGT